MLTTSKMTGLDLGSGGGGGGHVALNNTSQQEEAIKRSSEELLTTPKLMNVSPNFLPKQQESNSTASTSNTLTVTSTNGGGQQTRSSEDMLTTPVVTTPKTADLWPPQLRLGTSGSPEPGGCGGAISPVDLGPTDLPLDSNIGLRSPCDGLLAKRRMFRTKQPSSLNSDSNSCDTPTSENSPRDLTTNKPIVTVAAPTNDNEAGDKYNENERPASGSCHNCDTSPPRPPAIHFKHPTTAASGKPESLRLKDAVSELPPYYTPSPLAVPSPNWSAVERYFTGEGLKTPKLLDHSVFDFLPQTPRSASKLASFRDRSPGLESDRYRGHDQRLSPRLSPRFPIPEKPTDLSGRLPPLSRVGDPPPYPSEAEDLSMAAKQVKPVTTASTSSPSSSITPPPSLHHHQQVVDHVPPPPPPVVHHHHHQLKQEYDRHSPPHMEVVKTEAPDDYVATTSSASSSFYLPPGFPAPFYPRQRYSPTPPPPTTAASRLSVLDTYESYPPHPHQPGGSGWAAAAAAAAATQHSLGHRPGLMHGLGGQPNWPPHEVMEDEGSSLSPPHHLLKGSSSLKIAGKKSPNRKADLEAGREQPSPIKKPRTGGGNGGGGKGKNKKVSSNDANGAKRVYSCPHCQRSYDWNYNLNRHLKYECGKENAFQCSKCGRKFPHKQNCVYHLKRKHKIICDTIDQYMSNGLVLFRGSNNPGGQQVANPQTASVAAS